MIKKIFLNTSFVILFLSYFLYSQPAPVTDLTAVSGIPSLPEGSIKLTWTYPGPEELPQGSTYYIQYSTYSEISWSTNTAQIKGDASGWLAYTVYETTITYLTGFDKSLPYYFCIWISSGTEQLLSEISNIATGYITLIVPPKPEWDYENGAIPGEKEGTISLRWGLSGDDYTDMKFDEGSQWRIDYSTYPEKEFSPENVKIIISTSGSVGWWVGTTVTGLNPGVTYYFRLWAVDDLGNISEISDSATSYAQVDISGPKPVTRIFKLSSGFRHINLSWIVPQEDSYDDGYIYNPSTYTGYYQIRYRTDGPILQETGPNSWEGATVIFSSGPLELVPFREIRITLTGLVNRTSYYLAIKVADERSNWSLVSSTSPLIIPFNTPPDCDAKDNHIVIDPVRNVSGLIVSTLTVRLSWHGTGWYTGKSSSDNSWDSEYGDFISSFTIHIISGTPTGVIISTISGIPGGSTFYILTGLSEDTTYYWRFTAFDSESAYKVIPATDLPRFITNSQNSAPLFPSEPILYPKTTVYHIIGGSATFYWKSAYDTDPGDFIVGYHIKISSSLNFVPYFLCPADGSLIKVSSWVMTSITSPSISNLLPYENQKLYWYVIAYDSGAPFGYVPLSTTTAVEWFYINQVGEPPKDFEVYPATGGVKKEIISGTTYYIVKSTPIILSWELTSDPDPDYYDVPNSRLYYEYISDYVVFICSGTVGKEPWASPGDPKAYNWRSFPGTPAITSFTIITELPGQVSSGTPHNTILALPIVENMTYYYRISARDGAPYQRQNLGKGMKETVSPSTGVPAMSFIIDFYLDPPSGYNLLTPTGTINPESLTPELTFEWSPARDPDPFDSVEHYFLYISTVLPVDSKDWGKFALWKTSFVPIIHTSTVVYCSSPALYPGTTYFCQVISYGKQEWSLEEKNIYGLLVSTGIFVISNNPPNRFDLLSPGTTVGQEITKIQIFRPTFSWKLATDPDRYDPIVSSYVVKLSSSVTFSPDKTMTIFVSTTQVVLDIDLQSRTTYYWYVLAYDKFNNFSQSRSTFVFYIENFPPNIPNLVSPINEIIVSTSDPEFKIYNSGDPDNDILSFTIQCSTLSHGFDTGIFISSSGFTFPVATYHSTITIFSPWILKENQRHFWRVVVEDYFTGSSTSSISSFWVNVVEEKPNEFDIFITSGLLSSPTPFFSWSPADDNDPKDYVSHYILYISTIYGSGYVIGVSSYVILYGSNTVSYQWSEPLKENASYIWWVEAVDTKGYYRKSTSTYTFTINVQDDDLDEFGLISPGSGTEFSRVAQPIPFQWEPANKTEWWENVRYTVYYSSSLSIIYSSTVVSGPYKYSPETYKIVPTTSVILSGLQENTTYFWWVKAEDVKNNIVIFTKFSTTFYFFVDTVNDPPNPFSILSPTGTVQTRTPEFRWEPATDNDDIISRYELKYSTDEKFAVSVTTGVIISPEEVPFILPSEYILNMLTTYYWKVTAYDSRTGSRLSDKTGTFYVPLFIPSTFTISSPGFKETIFTRTPDIEWSPSIHPEPNSKIEKYIVTLSTDKNFIPSLTLTTKTNFIKISDKLIQKITYYISIIAEDNWGIRSSYVVSEFYISSVNIPKKIKKIDYEYRLPGKFILSWKPVNVYEDGTQADDIVGYNIYRADTPEKLFYKIQVYKSLPTGGEKFEDNVWEAEYYYLIKVRTLTGVESDPSEIVSTYRKGSKIVINPGIEARVVLPAELIDELTLRNYTIDISTQYISQNEKKYLNIINKYNIQVTSFSSTIDYTFSSPIELQLKVDEENLFKSISSVSGANQSDLSPSLFKYDGKKYSFVPSTYDKTHKIIKTETTKLGNFVIRMVTGVTEPKIVEIEPKKIFTPTAEQQNIIKFKLANPSALSPEGEIYDLQLRYVAKLKLEETEGPTLSWDGKYESGEYVPKGVYIYKIKIGEKVFTGTVIVAK